MKDPAVLFYTSDFLTGTMLMTDEQTGKYIRLLCLQHQKGRLSEEHMKKICPTYDKDVYSKFKKSKKGEYYNVRLEEEIIRRRNYSESRRKNRLSKQSYVKHMETETETINENGDLAETNIKILKGEIYLENICMKKSLDMESVLDILNTFIIDQDLCDGLYRPIEEIKSHFINTLNHRLKDKPKVRTYQEWLKDNGLEDSELNQERHKKHREIWDEHKRKNRVST